MGAILYGVWVSIIFLIYIVIDKRVDNKISKLKDIMEEVDRTQEKNSDEWDILNRITRELYDEENK